MAATTAEIFRALANTDRLAILDHLRKSPHGRASISEIAEQTGISRFSASHHLAILRDAELLEMSSVHHQRVHWLNHDTLRALEDWLYQFENV